MMKAYHLNVAVAVMLTGVTCSIAAVDKQINSTDAVLMAPGNVQNEVRIGVDPSNSNNIFAAYNDLPGKAPNPIGISFSSDGGTSWSETQLTVSPSHPTSGATLDDNFDPFLNYDSFGNAYAGYIGRPSSGSGVPDSAIFIERSINGGATWSGPTAIDSDLGDPTGTSPTVLFNDRPSMDTSTATGDLVVTWIKDVGAGTTTSDIYYSSATKPVGMPMPGTMNPTGLTFTTPVIVNDNSALSGGSDRGIAPDIAIHPNGNVFVAWVDYDVTVTDATSGSIKIDSTTIGNPMPFFMSPDTTVVSAINPLPKHVSTTAGGGSTFDDARAQSYPSIAVDPTDATGNTVYLTYAEEGTNSGDEGDIFFTFSTNGTAGPWSKPITINDDGTDTDQMHPNIAVKPDGTIDIVWYDKRLSPNDDMWDVYITRSTDGGLTFSPNLRVTDTSFATPTNSLGSEPWLGEYLGIDTDAGDAFIAFTSGTNDSFGDVFFDRIPNSSIPEPTTAAALTALVGSVTINQRRKTPCVS